VTVIKLVRIVEISQPRPGWSIVRFDNGALREIEWKRYAKAGTVHERLADPEFSAQCKAVQHGYGLEWPDGMDWSSGAVLKAGRPLHCPVGGALFRAAPRNGRTHPAPRAQPHAAAKAIAGPKK
jgi:hypothetical protein